MPAKIIEQIKELILRNFNGAVDFNDPLKVKVTPHNPIVYIHSVAADPLSGVWLMCDAGHWFKAEEEDKNILPVVQSVLQRLNSIYNGTISS